MLVCMCVCLYVCVYECIYAPAPQGMSDIHAYKHICDAMPRPAACSDTMPSTPGGHVAKVVIRATTAFVIEQSALHDDVTKQYVWSLYTRYHLPARL